MINIKIEMGKKEIELNGKKVIDKTKAGAKKTSKLLGKILNKAGKKLQEWGGE